MERNSRPVITAMVGQDLHGYCMQTPTQRISLPNDLAEPLSAVFSRASGHRTIEELSSTDLSESLLVQVFDQLEQLGLCFDAHRAALYGHRAANYPDALRIYPGDEASSLLTRLPADPTGDFVSSEWNIDESHPLRRRKTCRSFSATPMNFIELSEIGGTAYGIISDGNSAKPRTVPSAGAMYPLHFNYIIRNVEGLTPGLYLWSKHRNGFIHRKNCKDKDIEPTFLDDQWTNAAVIQVVTFDIDRSAAKYSSRAHRFALIEAGHAVQNSMIRATELNLGVWEHGNYADTEMLSLVEHDSVTAGMATVVFYGHQS